MPCLLVQAAAPSTRGTLQDWPVKPPIKIPDSGFAETSSGGWRGRQSLSPSSDRTGDSPPKAGLSPDGSPGRGSSCSPGRTPTDSPQKARPGQQGSPRLSMAPPKSAHRPQGAPPALLHISQERHPCARAGSCAYGHYDSACASPMPACQCASC